MPHFSVVAPVSAVVLLGFIGNAMALPSYRCVAINQCSPSSITSYPPCSASSQCTAELLSGVPPQTGTFVPRAAVSGTSVATAAPTATAMATSAATKAPATATPQSMVATPVSTAAKTVTSVPTVPPTSTNTPLPTATSTATPTVTPTPTPTAGRCCNIDNCGPWSLLCGTIANSAQCNSAVFAKGSGVGSLAVVQPGTTGATTVRACTWFAPVPSGWACPNVRSPGEAMTTSNCPGYCQGTEAWTIVNGNGSVPCMCFSPMDWVLTSSSTVGSTVTKNYTCCVPRDDNPTGVDAIGRCKTPSNVVCEVWNTGAPAQCIKWVVSQVSSDTSTVPANTTSNSGSPTNCCVGQPTGKVVCCGKAAADHSYCGTLAKAATASSPAVDGCATLKAIVADTLTRSTNTVVEYPCSTLPGTDCDTRCVTTTCP